MVDKIQEMLDTLEDDIYGNVDTIQSALGSAIDQIDSFANQTTLWQDDIINYETEEFNLRSYRKMGVMVVFVASVVVTVFGFIGILASRTSKCNGLYRLLNFTAIFSALLGTVTLLLASTTLSASIAWYDICQISNIVTSDFEPFLGEKIARGANACFNDTNLAVAL